MNLIPALRLNLDPASPDVVAFVGAGGKSSAMFRLAEEIAARGERVITTTTTRIAADQIRLSPAFASVTDGCLPLAVINDGLDQHGQCLLIGRESIERGAGVKKAGIAPHQVDKLAEQARALGVSAILIEADGSRMLPAKAPASHEPALPASTTVMVPIMGMDALGLPINEEHVQRATLIRRLLGLADDEPARLTPAHMARLLWHPEGGAKLRPLNARFIPLLNKADDAPRMAGARLIADLLARREISVLIGRLGAADHSPIRERWGPVAVILLAAGASTRMGAPKQLLAVNGEPMALRAVRVALQSGAEQVIIVTGAYEEAVMATLTPLLASAGERLRVVHNAAWADGQAASMNAGLMACSATTEAALFMPVDQPYLEAALLRRLISCWRQGARMATPEVDGQIRGAPGLFDRSLWSDLMEIGGDVGGRPLLRRHRSQVVSVPSSVEKLRDIDTPADLG